MTSPTIRRVGNKPKMIMRSLRVLSDVIREALERYVRRTR